MTHFTFKSIKNKIKLKHSVCNSVTNKTDQLYSHNDLLLMWVQHIGAKHMVDSICSASVTLSNPKTLFQDSLQTVTPSVQLRDTSKCGVTRFLL